MKNKLIIISLLLFSYFAFVNTSNANPDSTQVRVLISFFSVSAGIDKDSKTAVDSYISSFEKKNKVTLEKNITYWGREGEVDYCMTLSEISSKKQKKFVSGLLKLSKSLSRVSIKENTTCIRKR